MDGATERAGEEGGPFGGPLFETPGTGKLNRVGVVDIGSNSVRLVIFDGAARSPAYFFNEKVLCGLGDGLSETGRLNPEGRQRALDALRRFQSLADGLGLGPLSAVATAAVREATDGPEFEAQVREQTGIRLFVIDGPEEARLSAQGVLLGWPQAEGLVCDIGGSSMELARLEQGEIGHRLSLKLGPLKLRGLKGGRKARRAHIDETLGAVADALGDRPRRLYLVGGSWRAIARIDMARRDYPLKVLHEYRMTAEDIQLTLDWINEADPEVLRAESGVAAGRMALVPLAAEVLAGLMRVLGPDDLAVSGYGLREGLLFEHMPPALRARDPLIEACRFAEAKDARVPGFGDVLYRFIRPIYAGADPARLRLVRAACLLHDVSWRSHPDYRGDICFDYATRANFGGIDHAERVFLGLSLLHRYKNARGPEPRFAPLLSLLTEEEARAAEILGRAMRFGAMFTAQRADQMGVLRWHPEERRLVLAIGPEARVLCGEVATGRFAALGKALGAETEIVALHCAPG